MVFYVPIVMFSIILLVLPFSATLQRLMIARFHLRSQSFVLWAALQFSPSMYNFENEIWIGPGPLSRAMLRGQEALPSGTDHYWVNHFPLHDVSFDPRYRKILYERGQSFVYVRSRYGGTEMVSAYQVSSDAQGIHLLRLDGEGS